MPRVHYFVGKRAFGTSAFYDVESRPVNYRYVCPECGESWAEVFVEGSAGEHTWAVHMRHCAEHGRRWEALVDIVPGGISENLLRRDAHPAQTAIALESLPLLLQNREVLLRILHLERIENAQE